MSTSSVSHPCAGQYVSEVSTSEDGVLSAVLYVPSWLHMAGEDVPTMVRSLVLFLPMVRRNRPVVADSRAGGTV